MWLDILLVLLVAAALFFAVRRLLRDKKQGKCSCGCSACPKSLPCSAVRQNGEGVTK